jgi:hypothetical protein
MPVGSEGTGQVDLVFFPPADINHPVQTYLPTGRKGRVITPGYYKSGRGA